MGAKNSKRPKYDEEIDRIISIEERLDRGYHEFLNNHTRDRVGFITDYTIAEPTPVIDSEYLKSVSREPYQENKMNDIIKQLDKKIMDHVVDISKKNGSNLRRCIYTLPFMIDGHITFDFGPEFDRELIRNIEKRKGISCKRLQNNDQGLARYLITW